MLQYTGGTTGLPKGVILTHANLGTNCRQVLDIIDVNAETHHTFISILPFFHVYGLTTGLIIPVALAATSLPLPRYVPQDVLRLIARHKPTIFPGAPAVYISLLQQKNLAQYSLKSIRICVSGSAPLPREIFRRFQDVTALPSWKATASPKPRPSPISIPWVAKARKPIPSACLCPAPTRALLTWRAAHRLCPRARWGN